MKQTQLTAIIAMAFVGCVFNSTANAAELRVGSAETYLTIQAAYNAASAGDTILVVDATHNEQGIAINRAAVLSITISGMGALNTEIVGSGTNRIFTVTQGQVTFRDMTIRDGNIAGAGGGIYYYLAGGSLTIENCAVSNMTASTNDGGGVYFGVWIWAPAGFKSATETTEPLKARLPMSKSSCRSRLTSMCFPSSPSVLKGKKENPW